MPNSADDSLNSRAVASAPHEVKARRLNVVFVLARRDRRGGQGGRIGDALERRGGGVARVDRLLDAEDEEDEEEGGEELEKCRPLVPP